MTLNINDMTPRQLAAGLMRGNKDEFKLGYGPHAAAHAAANRNGLSESEFRELVAYCEGFHDGLSEDNSQVNLTARESEAVIPSLPDGVHRG
jgi:hypothetical protein